MPSADLPDRVAFASNPADLVSLSETRCFPDPGGRGVKNRAVQNLPKLSPTMLRSCHRRTSGMPRIWIWLLAATLPWVALYWLFTWLT
ncbi:MAG TPA: hypothetical protein VGN60_08715 [Devosia sp.]|jgi:hypothetical protein|nr:hypothetical protein [Devosia sp.]